jgi:N-methylhydantoinase A
VGSELGLDALETARGVVRVANAEMVRALRVISVERGLDPRAFALVAFGGAGGMHACALAEELGMGTILVPRAGGVLSALGLAISDLRRDYVRPLPALLSEVEDERVEAAFAELEMAAAGDLDDPAVQRRADVRYRRQSFELTVDAGDLAGLAGRFHDAHERRYGYRMEDEPLELVSLRVVATVAVDKPPLRAGEPVGEVTGGERRVHFDGDWELVPVLRGAGMGVGFEVEGPAIVELPEATCVVRPGWRGTLDDAGTLVLTRGSDASAARPGVAAEARA